MRTWNDVLKISGLIWIGLVAWAIVLGLAALAGFGWCVILFPPSLVVYGWMVYAFLSYRKSRQDELLLVLTTAIECRAPLPAALRGYVADRPHGLAREVWVAVLMFFVFPGYYALVHRRNRFDRRVDALARRLDRGESLANALRAVPAVASRETRLAAAVGEATGRLAECLRRADRERLPTVWLEVIPRLLYPAILLLFVLAMVNFMALAVLPKFERIFKDFGEALPALTAWLLHWSREADATNAVIVGGIQLAVVAGLCLVLSPSLRWCTPVVGWVYRWDTQGMVLRLLGSVLETGTPAPAALGLLVDLGDFPPVVRDRLAWARSRIEQGESLPVALRAAGLIPPPMVPLVQTSERVHTLPATLTELGNRSAARAVRFLRKTSQLLSPALVFSVGVLVGLVSLGTFLPLIQLLTRFSE